MDRVELVVSVGRDDENGNGLDPAGEQPQYVEGSLIRPVHVFEHEDGRSMRAQVANERRHDLMRLRAALDQCAKLAADAFRYGKQRSEWTRREEHVAGAPEHTNPFRLVVAELADERRLPDPCLTGHEHNAPATFDRLRERLLQVFAGLLTFE